jgi:hypothetical protein
MTKKLEALLHLAPAVEDPTQEQAEDFIKENFDLIEEVDSAISKIDIALPTVRDLDTADAELDALAELAKTKAEDLIDLGMNTDPRFAGVILQTAGVMLGHSITAKTAKMDKKLRMINLQLQKAKLDHQIQKDSKSADGAEEPIEGQGIVLDRNELLKQILGKQNK